MKGWRDERKRRGKGKKKRKGNEITIANLPLTSPKETATGMWWMLSGTVSFSSAVNTFSFPSATTTASCLAESKAAIVAMLQQSTRFPSSSSTCKSILTSHTLFPAMMHSDSTSSARLRRMARSTTRPSTACAARGLVCWLDMDMKESRWEREWKRWVGEWMRVNEREGERRREKERERDEKERKVVRVNERKGWAERDERSKERREEREEVREWVCGGWCGR